MPRKELKIESKQFSSNDSINIQKYIKTINKYLQKSEGSMTTSDEQSEKEDESGTTKKSSSNKKATKGKNNGSSNQGTGNNHGTINGGL